MFECLGCGKPFIGSAVGGIPEIIKSDRYGLTFEKGNVEDGYEAVVKSLHLEWNEREIIEYASEFSWQALALRIYEIQKSFLG